MRAHQLVSKKEERKESVNSYWADVCQNGMYPILKRLVRVGLVLPHGNAEVERLFSMLQDIFTKKRNSLDQHSLRALTFIKSFMTANNYQCHNFPITPALRDRVQNAKRSYQIRLKEQAEESERKAQDEKALKIQEMLNSAKEQSKKLKRLDADMEQVSQRK